MELSSQQPGTGLLYQCPPDCHTPYVGYVGSGVRNHSDSQNPAEKNRDRRQPILAAIRHSGIYLLYNAESKRLVQACKIHMFSIVGVLVIGYLIGILIFKDLSNYIGYFLGKHVKLDQ